MNYSVVRIAFSRSKSRFLLRITIYSHRDDRNLNGNERVSKGVDCRERNVPETLLCARRNASSCSTGKIIRRRPDVVESNDSKQLNLLLSAIVHMFVPFQSIFGRRMSNAH